MIKSYLLGAAALLAFPLAVSASERAEYSGTGYTIYTDFRIDTAVSGSGALPEGAAGLFGNSPVYEEKSDHPDYLAFIVRDGETRGILLRKTVTFKCRTAGADCVPAGISAEKNGRRFTAEASDFSDFQRIFKILKESPDVKSVMPQTDAGIQFGKM